jgi:HrpA-like RNA helicase
MLRVAHRKMSKLPTLLEAGSLRLSSGAVPTESPMDFITAWFRARMPEFGYHAAALVDRVLIIQAETGSGKSTVLPVGLFRLLRGKDTAARIRYVGPSVICTQPRVLTALALARDVAAERSSWNPDMVVGNTVGFQTGPLSDRPPAGLIFATAGVLAAQLRRLEDIEIMERYRFILVDEAHERSLDSDMLLALLHGFYRRNVGNERLPFLVLTSATIEPARYAAYFGVPAENTLKIVGRQFGIEDHWAAVGTNDFPRAAAELAAKIHGENPDDPPERADILIFMPGAAESEKVREYLSKLNTIGTSDDPKTERKGFLVLTINREVVISQAGDYPLVFERSEKLPGRPARRIIISTVVAETGLTIDTLKYVIDQGWNRAHEVYQPWGVEGLVTRPAAQSRVWQRRGRVGRLFPGEFHPLYTENVFKALETTQLPEIILSGPAGIHLALVREQQRHKLKVGAAPEFRVEDMHLLDPPPLEAFLAANATAVLLGFVAFRAPLPDRWPVDPTSATTDKKPLAATHGYGLTPLGFVASALSRVSMEGARILLGSYQWGAAMSDLVTVVAVLGRRPVDFYSVEVRRARRNADPAADQHRLPKGTEALKAALPKYLVARTTGGGPATTPVPPTDSEMFYFRAKLLIADDFVEALLIFDEFARRLDESQGDVAAVAAWCAEVELNYDTLLEIARHRETIIEEAVVAGLNPFRLSERRLGAAPLEEFVDRLTRLKRCLYDGLRVRLLRYDEKHADGPGYCTEAGLRVKIPDLFTDGMLRRLDALFGSPTERPARPKWLLTDRIGLKGVPMRPEEKSPQMLYTPEANLVSVLDGFVYPDPDFVRPRSWAAE